ncbi:MAG: hypothetical protein ACLSFO_05105, partial [Anaerovoracaceae bacterium]
DKYTSDRHVFTSATWIRDTSEIDFGNNSGREIFLRHLPQAEKKQRSFPWIKQVKLDVWAKDKDDVIYATERPEAKHLFSHKKLPTDNHSCQCGSSFLLR